MDLKFYLIASARNANFGLKKFLQFFFFGKNYNFKFYTFITYTLNSIIKLKVN